MRKFFYLSGVLALSLFGLTHLNSLEAKNSVRSLDCAGLYNAIVTLGQAEYKTPAIWRALEGDQYGYEQFRDAAEGPAGSIVAGGVSAGSDSQSFNPYLVAFSSKGQVKWEALEKTPTDQTIEAVTRYGERYVTLGDVINPENSNRGLNVRFYDRKGKFQEEKKIFDQSYDFYAMDMAVTGPSNLLSLLVWAKNPADRTDQYSFLLQIDEKGEVVRRRNYQPGPNNKLVSLVSKTDGTMIATGWIEQSDGRKAGWVVRMGPSGYLMWQRPYRRGKNAVLNISESHPAGGIVVAGYSEPVSSASEDNNAAWALWLDPSGEPKWERFWRSDYDLDGRDIMTVDGERIQVLVQANTDDARKRSHAKILSLTLRGQLLQEEAFMEGGNTHGRILLRHPSGKRSIIGYAQTVFSLGGEGSRQRPGIYDAWVLRANAPGPYQDPCKPGAGGARTLR